jgi:hypothetical protein
MIPIRSNTLGTRETEGRQLASAFIARPHLPYDLDPEPAGSISPGVIMTPREQHELNSPMGDGYRLRTLP